MRSRTRALLLGLPLALAACTSSGGGSPASSSSTTSGPKTCSVDSAADVHQFVLSGSGFTVTCARVTKGTDVFFVNDTGQPAEVTLARGDAEDFDAQLPNEGSTFTHAFNALGTYVVNAKPTGSLTLFVVD